MDTKQIDSSTFVPFKKGFVLTPEKVEKYRPTILLLREAVPVHFSDEMIDWDGREYYQFLHNARVVCQTEVHLADHEGKETWLSSSPKEAISKSRGILLKSELALVTDVKQDPPQSLTYVKMLPRLRYPCHTLESWENISFSVVCDALLWRLPVLKTKEKERFSTAYNPIYTPQIQARIYNPTQERLAEASRAYANFGEFIIAHSKEVLSAAQLMYGAIRIRDYAKTIESSFHNDCEESARHINQSASDLEARANDIVTRLNPPDTGLQKYVVN